VNVRPSDPIPKKAGAGLAMAGSVERHYFRACAAPAGGSQEKTWRGRRHASAGPKHMSSSSSLRHHRHLLPPPLATHSPRVARSRHGGASARPDPALALPAPAAAAAEKAAQIRSRESKAADLLTLAMAGCGR
jgi:hypothetical protein